MDKKIAGEKGGISLRTLFAWLIVIAVIISGFMIYSTFRLTNAFDKLSVAMEKYIDLEKTAYQLMDASDYLTENAQRFTVDGKRQYMDNYFEEALESKRREAAIDKLSEDPKSKAALKQLEKAMAESKDLMNEEYYAMRLVIEAKGYKDYPEILDSVKLTDEDAALSYSGKMSRASEVVIGEKYYAKKEKIRENMKESLLELEKQTREAQKKTAATMKNEILLDRIVILIQALGIFLLIYLTSVLGINPVLKAVDRIKNDDPIPVVGANEFRYLAKTYNKMYDVYKKSIEHLNYKASHDELTGVYNRAGYDLLVESIDLATTYMMVIDVDDFKKVNDEYGHNAGDNVLIRVAKVLQMFFRSDDYVCRVGGDEFVVLMVHSSRNSDKLIAAKVEDINRELAKGNTDDAPAASISAGVAHGDEHDTSQTLFEKADKALYETKKSGKRGYSFYN